MTPTQTFAFALMCASAFTYDLPDHVHNCTNIGNGDNDVCNIIRYADQVGTVEQRHEINSGKNNEKSRILLIEDDYKNNLYLPDDNIDSINSTKNVFSALKDSWTEKRQFRNFSKLDTVFSYEDADLLKTNYYHLTSSDPEVNEDISKIFTKNLFSDVSQKEIIWKLTDEQYYAMPRLFELEEYSSCLGARGVYCLGSFELAPTGTSPLFRVMQKFSANWVDNFNHTRLHRGVCLTRTCPPPHTHALDAWLESCVNASTMSSYNLTAHLYHLDYCTSGAEQPPPLTTNHKAFAVFVIVLVTLAVISTILDCILDEDFKKDYGWALSWSLICSWRCLTAPAQVSKTDLSFFDDLRVLCMLCVIVEHVCWLGTQAYVADTRYIEMNRWSSDVLLLANSTLLVQVFFMMASFLLAHKLLNEQNKGASVATFCKTMLNRVIRISPSYFVVVWFASTWWERLSDGPQWRSLVGAEARMCQNKWWIQLLYISNLVKDDGLCLVQTWYLAADMQLYALALALTLWLRGSKRAVLTLASIFGAVVVVNFIIAYTLRLIPTFFMHNPESVRVTYKGEPSLAWMYTSPQSNAVGTLAGLLLAHLYHATSTTMAQTLISSKVFLCAVALSAPAATLFMAVSPRALGGGSLGRLPAAALAALERPVFTLLVTLAAYGALISIKSRWLQWISRGSVAARLSFGALLLHMLIIKSFNASRLTPTHVDRFSVVLGWCGASAVSYAAAVPLAALVELPALKLHKELALLLRRRTDRKLTTKQ